GASLDPRARRTSRGAADPVARVPGREAAAQAHGLTPPSEAASPSGGAAFVVPRYEAAASVRSEDFALDHVGAAATTAAGPAEHPPEESCGDGGLEQGPGDRPREGQDEEEADDIGEEPRGEQQRAAHQDE